MKWPTVCRARCYYLFCRLTTAPVALYKRFLIVFLLGFSSGLPLALLSTTLQAWYASSGMPLMATGLLSLIGLPYVFRVLWSPFVDHYALLPLGKRRSWIVIMQGLLLVGFNALAWLSPDSSPQAMAFLAFFLACCSATQDVAIDAHRTEYLLTHEQGLGASLAVFGYRMALLIAGGVALILAQYIGFAMTYRVMGFLMLIGMGGILASPEPSIATSVPIRTNAYVFIMPFKALWMKKGTLSLACFIFFYKLGEAFTTTTSGIVMPFLIQGLGFSLETIGYINKIIGIAAIVMGGLTAGLLLLRWSLFRALLVFGLVQALTNVLFAVLAMVGKNTLLLAIAVFSDNFAAGMGSTALVALIMRLVDKRYTGTHFSIWVAWSTLPRILSGPLGAVLQGLLGWIGLYELSFLLALVFVPLMGFIELDAD